MTNHSQPSKKYQRFEDREWYNLRSILGNDWAMFYFLLGGREARQELRHHQILRGPMEKEETPILLDATY